MTIRILNTAELDAVAGGGYPLPEPATPDPFIAIGGGSPMIGIGTGSGRDWWNPGWFFGPPALGPVLPVKPVGPGFP